LLSVRIIYCFIIFYVGVSKLASLSILPLTF